MIYLLYTPNWKRVVIIYNPSVTNDVTYRLINSLLMKPAARFFLKLQELHKNRRLFLSIGYYYHMYVYKPKLNLLCGGHSIFVWRYPSNKNFNKFIFIEGGFQSSGVPWKKTWYISGEENQNQFPTFFVNFSAKRKLQQFARVQELDQISWSRSYKENLVLKRRN